MSGVPQRTLLLWCPDWPVLAAEIVDGVPATDPVVVLHANRVVACSERARAEGIRRGLRRREAQGRCPHLTVVDHDPGRDARAFEPVVAAVEEVVAGVEVIRPGACATAARGPSRYLGGEEAAAERIVEHVAQSCAVESQVGIADGVFAAGLAAREGRIVAPGGTREFLATRPVEALGRPALADLLRRLGVRTLGDFAALPAGDVLARFGFDGALAHRLAGGRDDRPLAVRQPPADLIVTADYDEPVDRVDAAAFAARTLAELLHERLAGYGLACTRLGIEAVTAHGQELHRVWRHDGLLTAAAIADRVRWQLDGWLTGSNGRGGMRPARPTAGIVRLRLVPDGVLAQAGLQPGLWGETCPTSSATPSYSPISTRTMSPSTRSAGTMPSVRSGTASASSATAATASSGSSRNSTGRASPRTRASVLSSRSDPQSPAPTSPTLCASSRRWPSSPKKSTKTSSSNRMDGTRVPRPSTSPWSTAPLAICKSTQPAAAVSPRKRQRLSCVRCSEAWRTCTRRSLHTET
nr:DNA polymerase Y family protein [Micromonospora sp. XM-20-01]